MNSKSYVFDCHNDLGLYILEKREIGFKNVLNDYYYGDMKKGNVGAVVAAVFIEDKYIPEMSFKRGLMQVLAIKKDVEECCDHFMICRNTNDLKHARNQDKIGVFISLEGIEPLNNNLEILDIFYDMGVSICGISWSRRNSASDGCEFTVADTWRKGGLTPFGKDVVKRAVELGMAIDVTHMSEEAFFNTFSITKTPIIASHTNAVKVCNIRRNFTDEQIEAIAETGGIVCINGVDFIVTNDEEKMNTEGFADQVDYIKKLVGIDHIGIGLDFVSYHRTKHYHPDRVEVEHGDITDVIENYEMMNKLKNVLTERKYSDEEIEKVFNKNLIRVLEHYISDSITD